jgi:hypothetical protein
MLGSASNTRRISRHELVNDEWLQHVSNVKNRFPGRENTIDQMNALMAEVRSLFLTIFANLESQQTRVTRLGSFGEMLRLERNPLFVPCLLRSGNESRTPIAARHLSPAFCTSLFWINWPVMKCLKQMHSPEVVNVHLWTTLFGN